LPCGPVASTAMGGPLGIGELKKRLAREHAKIGDITVSLIWNDPSDLDLCATIHQGKKATLINKFKKKACGAHLDVEMNESETANFSLQPVENIYFTSPVAGYYRIWVRNANMRTMPKQWPQPEFRNPNRKIPFKCYLHKDGKVQAFEGAVEGGFSGAETTCFEFTVDGCQSDKAEAAPITKAGTKLVAKRPASVAASAALASAPAPKRAKTTGGGGGGIAGKAIVFTGTLFTPRATASAAATAAGAKVLGAISRSADILVAGSGAGGKIGKAEALGVQVWDELRFKKAVGL